MRQFQEGVFSLLHVVKAFQRRRGGAEQDDRFLHPSAHHGDVPRMITGRFLLLVGILVFLINDDQPEWVHRRKNSRTRADDDAGAALADFVPFVVALACGQVAVQHGNQGLEPAGGEPGLEPLDRLRRKRDFRDQHNCPFAQLQGASDGLKVNLGLAAPGDAVEEEGV